MPEPKKIKITQVKSIVDHLEAAKLTIKAWDSADRIILLSRMTLRRFAA